jgi:hypothetical protein
MRSTLAAPVAEIRYAEQDEREGRERTHMVPNLVVPTAAVATMASHLTSDVHMVAPPAPLR